MKVPAYGGTRREREAITPARQEWFADDPRSFVASGQPSFREQHADSARVGSAIRSRTPRKAKPKRLGFDNLWITNPLGMNSFIKGFTGVSKITEG